MGQGWPTLLVLGAAYGIAEEGLMCKSFFDPNWEDLKALGGYGRWAGVNWVWSQGLTIYHCVFSIAIPILLVSIMFPARRDQSWVSRRKFIVLAILWVANADFILFITPYRPPVVHYLLTMAITIGLVVLAGRLPRSMFNFVGAERKSYRALWFLPVGFVGTLALFFLEWILPKTSLHPILLMLLVIGLVILVGWIVLHLSGGGVAWSERHQLALASGALVFFILLAPLQELDKNRTDNTTGMAIVGLVMAIFLIWLVLRVRAIERSAIGGQTEPV